VAARIAVASDTPADPQFSCATTFFRTMAAETRGETGVLYRVTRDKTAAPPPAWETAADAIEGLTGGLLSGLAGDLVAALHLKLPCVVLKQFRAAGAPQTACFQAIVDSPVEATGFHGGGLLLDTFTLEITTCESHGIVRDLLGRAPDAGRTVVPVTFAAWVRVDFSALSGNDIVRTA
jgi:hypothetical protein